MAKERVQKTKAAPQEKQAETAHSEGGEQADLTDTDALLDEIDTILEEQEVLTNYRQRGGQ